MSGNPDNLFNTIRFTYKITDNHNIRKINSY